MAAEHTKHMEDQVDWSGPPNPQLRRFYQSLDRYIDIIENGSPNNIIENKGRSETFTQALKTRDALDAQGKNGAMELGGLYINLSRELKDTKEAFDKLEKAKGIDVNTTAGREQYEKDWKEALKKAGVIADNADGTSKVVNITDENYLKVIEKIQASKTGFQDQAEEMQESKQQITASIKEMAKLAGQKDQTDALVRKYIDRSSPDKTELTAGNAAAWQEYVALMKELKTKYEQEKYDKKWEDFVKENNLTGPGAKRETIKKLLDNEGKKNTLVEPPALTELPNGGTHLLQATIKINGKDTNVTLSGKIDKDNKFIADNVYDANKKTWVNLEESIKIQTVTAKGRKTFTVSPQDIEKLQEDDKLKKQVTAMIASRSTDPAAPTTPPPPDKDKDKPKEPDDLQKFIKTMFEQLGVFGGMIAALFAPLIAKFTGQSSADAKQAQEWRDHTKQNAQDLTRGLEAGEKAQAVAALRAQSGLLKETAQYKKAHRGNSSVDERWSALEEKAATNLEKMTSEQIKEFYQQYKTGLDNANSREATLRRMVQDLANGPGSDAKKKEQNAMIESALGLHNVPARAGGVTARINAGKTNETTVQFSHDDKGNLVIKDKDGEALQTGTRIVVSTIEVEGKPKTTLIRPITLEVKDVAGHVAAPPPGGSRPPAEREQGK